MNHDGFVSRACRPWRPAAAWIAALTLIAFAVPPAAARERAPFAARSGLELARAAASAWAPDAFLVYVENDEPLDARGAATRWGYLFFSPGASKSRAYSVRDGKIAAAENLEMKFEAPPLAAEWVDSGPALAAADHSAGRAYCREQGGRLETMLLIRGPFLEGDADETTWTLVYTSPRAPSLFVMVGASDGKVRRTWRG